MKVRETAARDGAVDEAQAQAERRKRFLVSFAIYLLLEKSRHSQAASISSAFWIFIATWLRLRSSLEKHSLCLLARWRTHVVCAIFASCPKVASDKCSTPTPPPHSNSSGQQQVALDSTWHRLPPFVAVFVAIPPFLLAASRDGFDPTFQLRRSEPYVRWLPGRWEGHFGLGEWHLMYGSLHVTWAAF